MRDERARAPGKAAPPDAQNEEEWVEDTADDWVEEAQEEEWVEEGAPGAPPTSTGSPSRRPRETPPWVNWVAGLAGLLVGLLLFRSCG